MQAPSKPQRFPALSVPHFRYYAITACLAMVGDNVEHVIGYWVIWQLTHSTFWLGYALVAHWLPFTLLSLHSGSFADRFDCRWLIQVSQGLFITASIGWGVLFLTGELQVWHVAILLVVHGVAGLISAPSSMLIIHEMVGKEKLVSAISLNASLRPLAHMLGPLIGGGLMTWVGPGWGFLANVAIYLPLSVLLLYLPYGGAVERRGGEAGWDYVLQGLATVRRSLTIVALLVVVASTSFLVGNTFQAFMPPFAERLGASATGYSILLLAGGLGALGGGFLIGWIGSTKLRPVVVTTAVLMWTVLLIFFSFSTVYWISFGLLVLVGTTQIVFTSMAQSIIQAWAPPAVRGRVMGVYNLASSGTRVLSGVFLGSVAMRLGVVRGLIILAASIGVVVLATSSIIRSLWKSELDELPGQATTQGASAA
ncbi:MAG TPA: MFS transporter [Candidatus Binatia bacterium]